MSFYQTELPKDLMELAAESGLKLFQNRNNHRISVFISHFGEIEQVGANWKKVSNYIASSYQSTLTKKEDEFEKWNIYLLFTCTAAVNKTLRFEIENDKFSSRKIILERLAGDLDEQQANLLISQHISNDDLVIDPKAQSDDLHEIVNKYQSPTFVWDMIKDEEALNYKTASQKQILENIISRINNENK